MLTINGICYPDEEDIEMGIGIHAFGEEPSDDVEGERLVKRVKDLFKSEPVDNNMAPF